MRLKYILLVLGLFLAFMACKQGEPGAARGIAPAEGERMQMAPFKMVSLTDQMELDSSKLKGRVLLVTFFATWCPPCIMEIPSLIDLQGSFKPEEFSVVAFSVDEGDPAALKKLILKAEINYPVLLADSVVKRSFGGITGIPTTFLVNRQGEIVKKYVGYVGHDVLDKEIKKLLASG